MKPDTALKVSAICRELREGQISLWSAASFPQRNHYPSNHHGKEPEIDSEPLKKGGQAKRRTYRTLLLNMVKMKHSENGYTQRAVDGLQPWDK